MSSTSLSLSITGVRASTVPAGLVRDFPHFRRTSPVVHLKSCPIETECHKPHPCRITTPFRKSRDDMLSQQSLLLWVRGTKGGALRGEVSRLAEGTGDRILGSLHQYGIGNLRLSVLREG